MAPLKIDGEAQKRQNGRRVMRFAIDNPHMIPRTIKDILSGDFLKLKRNRKR
jgi:hypothetical protein